MFNQCEIIVREMLRTIIFKRVAGSFVRSLGVTIIRQTYYLHIYLHILRHKTIYGIERKKILLLKMRQQG